MNEEVISYLRQLEQLTAGVHAALKHSPPIARPLMSRQGFTYKRRIAIQRSTWVMVSQIRATIAELGGAK